MALRQIKTGLIERNPLYRRTRGSQLMSQILYALEKMQVIRILTLTRE